MVKDTTKHSGGTYLYDIGTKTDYGQEERPWWNFSCA